VFKIGTISRKAYANLMKTNCISGIFSVIIVQVLVFLRNFAAQYLIHLKQSIDN